MNITFNNRQRRLITKFFCGFHSKERVNLYEVFKATTYLAMILFYAAPDINESYSHYAVRYSFRYEVTIALRFTFIVEPALNTSVV